MSPFATDASVLKRTHGGLPKRCEKSDKRDARVKGVERVKCGREVALDLITRRGGSVVPSDKCLRDHADGALRAVDRGLNVLDAGSNGSVAREWTWLSASECGRSRE